MLSKLYRKAESLDDACLRAFGYPNDHGIRQELLDALEWKGALRPDHARPSIRELYDQVHTASFELAGRIRKSSHGPDGLLPADVDQLRRRLTALMEALETVLPTPVEAAKK